MIVVADTSPINYLLQLSAVDLLQKLYGLAVTGTLGVLRNAHAAGLADGRLLFSRLRAETSFRSSAEVDKAFLETLARRQH